MDCEVIQPDLAPYHFGAVDDRARAAVEAHLLGCRGCLSAFLALKRAIETAPEPRPSEAARARLRQAAGVVLDRLAAEQRRPRPLWARTATGLVLAAAGAAALGLLALRGSGPAPAGPLHDSARPIAESGRVL
jgi:putative zinc finger protein